MALSNFNRPDFPYNNKPLKNSNTFRVLTRSLDAPPTDIMIDSELNCLTDNLNIVDAKIEDVSAGILPGASNPNNANFFPTTDGEGNISWVPVRDVNCEEGTISGNKLIDFSVTAQQMADGTLTFNQMAPNANIPGTMLAANANILGTQMAPSAGIVGTQLAQNANLLGTQFADNADILGTQLAANANLLGTQFADNADILGTQLAANADILGTQMAPNANLLGTQLAANANILGTQMADGTITGTQINASYKPAAIKADQTTATSTTVYVNPAVQQFHPSAISFRCTFNGSLSGTNAPIEGYNVISITTISGGIYQVNLGITFATNNFTAFASCSEDGLGNFASALISNTSPPTTNYLVVKCYNNLFGNTGCPRVHVMGCGVIA